MLQNLHQEMSIDLPAQDGTLLRITMHRDGQGSFSGESQVAVQQHTRNGLHGLVTYSASGVQEAAAWRPMRPVELRLHDQVPGLTIKGAPLNALVDWIVLTFEADLDIWRRGE